MSLRVCYRLAGGIALLGLAHAAHADAIDGSWCHEPDQRLTIDGPAITTPGGHAITGGYARHFFSYVVPPDEPQAGVTMQMRLLNEQTMQMRAGPGAEIKTWLRCSPATS